MTSVMPWERPGSKIDDRHLQRLAVIYIRQSTRQQLVDHQESTRLQYALVDRAVALGWQADRVLVIDEDLGKSGSSAVARTGFQRLVTEIGLDHVGLVLGIEMSRLARSGRDWYQLIELCALSGAVLADTDGVYDPAEYNDRLLLGLKGTMSEAELHLIKQRMWSGRLNKARRGELAFALPSGYVRRPSGQVAFDPDEQVQTVIRLIFAQFERLGTLHGVLRYLVDHDIQLGIRLREGPDKGTLEWRRPNRMTLQTLLHNPAYAGIYAYGRRRVDPRRQDPARPSTGRVVRSRDGWHVMIPNVLPAYITVTQFETNEARLAANRAHAEAMGTVRGGPALAAGLVHCGRCNRRMSVRYHTQHSKALPEYVCARDMTNYGAEKSCQLLNSACVDAFVEQQVLAALTPAAVEVSLRAADQVLAERAELERLWSQRLGKASRGYDAGKKINCRKRHIAVDTKGMPVMIMVTPADMTDRDAAREMLWRLRLTHPQLTQVWADSAYAGQLVDWADGFLHITLKTVSRPKDAKGFVVLPRRWKVERTLGWIMHARRNVRDYERLPQHSKARLTWSLITLMTRRLTRTAAAQQAAGRR
jgi:DNA invertase Pin-like site-specific DNA recombinase/transposase